MAVEVDVEIKLEEEMVACKIKIGRQKGYHPDDRSFWAIFLLPYFGKTPAFPLVNYNNESWCALPENTECT